MNHQLFNNEISTLFKLGDNDDVVGKVQNNQNNDNNLSTQAQSQSHSVMSSELKCSANFNHKKQNYIENISKFAT